MKKEAYEVEYYEPKSVLAMQADRREEKHRRKQKKGIRAGRILLGVAILLFWEVSARPVSYTHLDVYKRQILIRQLFTTTA